MVLFQIATVFREGFILNVSNRLPEALVPERRKLPSRAIRSIGPCSQTVESFSMKSMTSGSKTKNLR